MSVPETAALFVVLVVLFVYFSLASQFFLEPARTSSTSSRTSRVVGIIACPATLLLIAGQFDLSVGLGGRVHRDAHGRRRAGPGRAAPRCPGRATCRSSRAFVVAVAGDAPGRRHQRVSVTVIGINALITTLGTLAIFRGLTKVLGNGQTIRINGFGELGVTRGSSGSRCPSTSSPPSVVIFWFILRYTVYGRSLYAIGASPTAARLAGIRVKRVIFIAFLLSSLCVALAGLIRLSQVGGASVNAGLGIELVGRHGGRPRRREPVGRPGRDRRARCWRC